MRESGVRIHIQPDPWISEELSTFEERLKSLENLARTKCRFALEEMGIIPLPARLLSLMEKEIFPLLFSVGFDQWVTRAIFNAAEKAWEPLKLDPERVRVIRPGVAVNIRKVREGVLRHGGRHSGTRPEWVGMDVETIRSLVNRAMHPANLFTALDDVSLSWIILPRAYDLLERDQLACILPYLRFLRNESEPAFTKILARIITEFVGNYSLKYLGENRNRERMIAALFHGYEVMFWKNLRNPPQGLQDALVFENFLRWAGMVHRKFAPSNSEMQEAIEDMERENAMTFPVYDAFETPQYEQYNVHRFLVALRHGMHGVKTVLRYFGIGGSLLQGRTVGRLPYNATPKTLNVLLRDIRERYLGETAETKRSIWECLSGLASVYGRKRMTRSSGENVSSNELRFVGPRVRGLIRDLKESITRWDPRAAS